ncbi:hypothetical protein [Bosea sp. MMO-172]|uniref:hypothetical protein n=1 Tax=Bosea sp. MMO-172 TaxID=3127885 RepID=UPI0030198559
MPTFTGRRVSTGSFMASAPAPYTTPSAAGLRPAPVSGDIGSAIASLGKAYQNGAANALRDAQRQKLDNENAATADGYAAVGEGGTIVDAMRFARAAAAGAVDPGKLAGAQALIGYQKDGPTSSFGTNALFARGEGRNTQYYFDQQFQHELQKKALEEETRVRVANTEAANRRVIADDAAVEVIDPATNRPVLLRRPDAIGKSPVLSTDQVRGATIQQLLPSASDAEKSRFAFGQAPTPTPRTYAADGKSFITYDGVIDAQSGQPLPIGGAIVAPQGTSKDVGIRPSVETALQQAQVDRQRFRGMLGFTRELAAKDPTLFGLPGQIRRIGQEGAQIANGLAQVFGKDNFAQARHEIIAELKSRGVSSKLIGDMFDPHLPGMQSAANLLVYQAASALAGQQGRSVTDKDLAMFKTIAGDPSSLFESQQSYLARLQTMEDLVNTLDSADITTSARSAGLPPARSQTPSYVPSSETPATTPPGAALGSDEAWVRGTDGKLRRAR